MNEADNGKLVAALVTIVDGVFGLLVVVHVISVAPAEALVTVAITVALNLAGIVLAYIQHSQHVVKLKLAADERMQVKHLEAMQLQALTVKGKKAA